MADYYKYEPWQKWSDREDLSDSSLPTYAHIIAYYGPQDDPPGKDLIEKEVTVEKLGGILQSLSCEEPLRYQYFFGAAVAQN